MTVEDHVNPFAELAVAVEGLRQMVARLTAERDDAQSMRRYHQNQRSKDAQELAAWQATARENEVLVSACQAELRTVRAERDRLADFVRRFDRAGSWDEVAQVSAEWRAPTPMTEPAGPRPPLAESIRAFVETWDGGA